MAEEKKGIIPLILGIIGGVLSLPGAICTGLCAGAAGVATSELARQAAITGGKELAAVTASAASSLYVYAVLGIIASIAGIVFAVLAKNKPLISGIVLIVAGLISFVTSGVLGWLGGILFIVGGVFALIEYNKAQKSQAA